MELIPYFITFAAGIVTGIMVYRYQLKKNPEKLEKWAAQAKSAGKAAGWF